MIRTQHVGDGFAVRGGRNMIRPPSEGVVHLIRPIVKLIRPADWTQDSGDGVAVSGGRNMIRPPSKA